MCLCSCGSRLPRAGTVCQRVSLIIGLVRLNGPVSGHVPDDNVDASAACLKLAITQNLDGRSCVSHATRWCLQVDDLTDPRPSLRAWTRALFLQIGPRLAGPRPHGCWLSSLEIRTPADRVSLLIFARRSKSVARSLLREFAARVAQISSLCFFVASMCSVLVERARVDPPELLFAQPDGRCLPHHVFVQLSLVPSVGPTHVVGDAASLSLSVICLHVGTACVHCLVSPSLRLVSLWHAPSTHLHVHFFLPSCASQPPRRNAACLFLHAVIHNPLTRLALDSWLNILISSSLFRSDDTSTTKNSLSGLQTQGPLSREASN